MPIKSRPWTDPLLLSVGALLIGGAAIAAPSLGTSGTKGDDPVRVSYALQAPNAQGVLAGVEKSAIVIPGLTLRDTVPDDGGLVLTYVDGSSAVRAVLRLEVANDGEGARRFLDRQLHGISRVLPQIEGTALGDLVYGDEAGATIVLGTQANIAFDVRLVDDPNGAGAVPTAKVIAGIVRAAMRPGAPTLPAPKVSLPTSISSKDGGDIAVTGVGASQTPQLRVEGGYVVHGAKGPVVRPFAAGPVTVRAIVVDELARVGIGTATTFAK